MMVKLDGEAIRQICVFKLCHFHHVCNSATIITLCVSFAESLHKLHASTPEVTRVATAILLRVLLGATGMLCVFKSVSGCNYRHNIGNGSAYSHWLGLGVSLYDTRGVNYDTFA